MSKQRRTKSSERRARIVELDTKRLSEENGPYLLPLMENAPSKYFDAKWGQEDGWPTVDFIPIVYHGFGGESRYRGN